MPDRCTKCKHPIIALRVKVFAGDTAEHGNVYLCERCVIAALTLYLNTATVSPPLPNRSADASRSARSTRHSKQPKFPYSYPLPQRLLRKLGLHKG